MDAVGAIDVGVACRAEHHRVAFGAASVGMRGRVSVVIGLDFDDRAADAINQQCRADHFGRDLVDRAVEK